MIFNVSGTRKRGGTSLNRRGDVGAHKDSTAPNDCFAVESAVLAYVLGERAEGVTIFELGIALNGGLVDITKNDAIERAVRELVRDGLLRMNGASVAPGNTNSCPEES